jgi:hypothetical protein
MNLDRYDLAGGWRKRKAFNFVLLLWFGSVKPLKSSLSWLAGRMARSPGQKPPMSTQPRRFLFEVYSIPGALVAQT